MLGIFADNHYVTMTLDDLALFADFLYGRLYFHSILPPFFCLLSCYGTTVFLWGGVRISALRTPRNPTFRRVIDRNFDRNLITGQYFDIVHSEFAGNMRGNDHIIRQLHLEGRVRQCFYDDTFKFDYIIFRQILFLPDRILILPVENAPS